MRFDRYWALSALLAGWGRNHPEVKPAIDALADAADEELDDLVALLPEIVPNKAAARERLIRLGMRAEVRRDMLATGLEACVPRVRRACRRPRASVGARRRGGRATCGNRCRLRG